MFLIWEFNPEVHKVLSGTYIAAKKNGIWLEGSWNPHFSLALYMGLVCANENNVNDANWQPDAF